MILDRRRAHLPARTRRRPRRRSICQPPGSTEVIDHEQPMTTNRISLFDGAIMRQQPLDQPSPSSTRATLAQPGDVRDRAGRAAMCHGPVRA
jgi:hypothetical protein